MKAIFPGFGKIGVASPYFCVRIGDEIVVGCSARFF
jgi:hypothetical protein